MKLKKNPYFSQRPTKYLIGFYVGTNRLELNRILRHKPLLLCIVWRSIAVIFDGKQLRPKHLIRPDWTRIKKFYISKRTHTRNWTRNLLPKNYFVPIAPDSTSICIIVTSSINSIYWTSVNLLIKCCLMNISSRFCHFWPVNCFYDPVRDF